MPKKGAFCACTVDRLKMRKLIERRIGEAEAFIIKQLAYIGEECVRIAREGGSYGDVTGNLRSSIGYVLLRNGVPLAQGKPRRYKSGASGAGAAAELLERLAGEFPSGIVLIVCAGMKYAAYVEEIRHKVVLSEAKLAAEQLARQLLRSLLK